MECLQCKAETCVLDTRIVGYEVKRRRECPACGYQFYTVEAVVDRKAELEERKRYEAAMDLLRRVGVIEMPAAPPAIPEELEVAEKVKPKAAVRVREIEAGMSARERIQAARERLNAMF